MVSKFTILCTLKRSIVSYALLFLVALSFSQHLFGQVHYELTGTPGSSGGGVGLPPGGFGPLNWNDGVIAAGPSCAESAQPWGWVTTNGTITYTWGAPVTFSKLVFYKSNRPMLSCNIQYWNGASFVNFYNYTVVSTCTEDSITFAPVTTTILQMTNVGGSSNPNFREIQVLGPAPNSAPTFTGGSPQSLNVCINSSTNSINSLLAISDADAGQTETWTVSSAPSHGSIATGGTMTSTGGTITPTGFSYSPTAGYTGTDAFTIQVSDGAGGTATTVINVTVNPTPPGITGPTSVCTTQSITLSDATGGGTWTSGTPGQATVVAGTGVVTGVAAGSPTINYTVGGCIVSYPITVIASPSAITGSSSVCTGSTITLSDAGGGTWTSSSPALATIDPATGVVTGYSTGTPTMSYTIGACSSTLIVTVNQTPTGISGTFSACVGGSTTLTNGYAGGAWTSSAPGVASINAASGLVTALTPGTTTITYTLPGGCTGTAVFTVNPNPAAIGGTFTVCAGSSITMTDATAGGVWLSSATGVATIWSGSGFLTGVASGTTNISYTLATGCYTTSPVTVNPLPASITGPTSVCVGSTITVSTVTGGITWSSSNTAIATVVAGSGVVTGVSAGTVTITCGIVATGCITTTTITVNPLPAAITGLNVVCAGSTITLSNATGGGTWSSSTAAATVIDSTGVVTGVSAGTPNISYTLPTGSCYVIYPITVNPLPAAIGGILTACPGTSTTLTDAGGGSWVSNNTAVATMAGAVATGVAAGTSTITYTLPTGCLITATLTINPNPAAITGTFSVCQGLTTTLASASGGGSWTSASPANASVGAGTGIVTGNIGSTTANITYTLPTGCLTSQLVTVNPLPAAIGGANNVCVGLTTTLTDATGASTWTSSNTANATIGAASGIVTGVATGAITITFTIPATGCIATMPFTVNPTPVAISGSNNVCVGFTTALSDATGGGTWSSSNAGLATVNALTGIVSGGSTGTLNIVYTLPAGCTATMPYTVNPTPPAIGGPTSVCTGLTMTLTNGTGGGTWTSSNTSMATVGGTGIVAGVSAGVLTITYTTTPGNCYAVRTITVYPTPSANTGTATVCSGLTTTLANSASGGTWSSATPANASVAGAGIVTGVTAGTTAVISYTLSTGCFANTTVTVNQQPSTITGATSVCTGATTTLINGIPAGTWTSSNPSVASIGGGTGIVSGVSAGTVTITYTLGSCFATYAFTVNQTPPAIVGNPQLCVGVSATFTDGIGGGTWTSSNVAAATIVGATGITSPLAAGTTNIVYTLPGGCTATLPATVNVQPGSISGSSTVCTGATTALTDGTVGGSWSSSSTGVASVGGTGIVSGISAGTATISYTMTGGCNVTFPMTVNLTPAAITGTPVVCVASTTTLSDATFGGAWSSSNPAQAGVGATTGIVTGVSAGTSTIIYTYPGGCTATVTVTVNALPAIYTVSGGGSYCAGGTGLHIGLSNSDAGINYQLYNTGVTSGASVGGAGVPLDFGLRTAAGTYTAIGTNATTGCSVAMAGGTSITINALPFAFTVTGGGSYCSGTSSTIHIGLNGSATFGATYQLMSGVTPVGAAIGGTGAVLDFGIYSTAGTYTVNGLYTATGCTSTMNGSATITVNALPPAHNVIGGGAYCAGASGVIIQLDGSDIGYSYQLYYGGSTSGSPMPGTGGILNFGLRTAAGSYTILATNNTSGCSVLMSGTAVITIYPLPTVFGVTAPGGLSYCIGGTGVAVGLTGSTIGVNYQLYRGGVATGGLVAGTGIALNMGTQTIQAIYTVVAINGTTSCSVNMTGQDSIYVNPLPTVYNVTASAGGVYCAGGSGVHILLNGSQIGVAYQLSNGFGTVGSPLTGTGGALDFGLQTVVSTYSVTATNITTTCTNPMTGTPSISTNPLPALYTMSANGSYCYGGTGVDVQLSGSQAGINYQLYLGASAVGAPMAGTGGILDWGNQLIGGTYTVQATNPASLCTIFMTGSTIITVNPLPTVFNMNGGGSYCSGGTGVVVGLSGSAAGVNYLLYTGGASVGGAIAGTGFAINFPAQTAAGAYTVVATSGPGCINNMSGSSNIAINPLPLAYTVTGVGGYCAGTTGTHIGLSSSDIGINYQLYNGAALSGSPVSGTGAALDFGVIAPIGTYTVSATNTVTGCTNGMTGSLVISINPLPTVFPVAGGGSYCAGGTGVAINLNGSDPAAKYQLYRGTIAVGGTVTGTGPGLLSMGTQTIAGTYTVVATNTATLCTNNMSGSATVVVNPLPNTYTIGGGGGYCTGGIGVNINLNGSNSGINYQLYRGAVGLLPIASGTGTPLSFGLQTVAGTYTVVATNPATTCTVNMLSSATVNINPLPAAQTVTGGGNYCSGGTGVHVGLATSVAGINYQLTLGGVAIGTPIPGSGLALDFGAKTTAGSYSVTGTDAVTGCSAPMTGSVNIVIDPLPLPVAVTGGGNYCPGGTGVTVGLMNSVIGTSYQVNLAGVPVGGSTLGIGVAMPLGVFTTPGTYRVTATLGSCSSTMPGSAVAGIYALPTVYTISGGGSYCAGGAGLPISLNGSDPGTTYRLYNNDTAISGVVSGTGSTINFGLETAGGSYMVIATSTITSCVDTMYDTASIVINPLPAIQTLTGGGSYCPSGTGVAISLGGSEAGVNYQLYRGTTAVGSPLPGTTLGLNFGLFTTTGIYKVVAINTSTLCSSTMSGNDTISLYPLPTAFNVNGGGSYCAGGAGRVIGINNSQTGIGYQLMLGTTPVGPSINGTGAALNFPIQTTPGIYTVTANNLTTGCTANMSGSATITINTLPYAFNLTGGGGYCAGGTGVHIGTSGSGTGVTYQLFNSGTAVGSALSGSGLALDFGLQSVAGLYKVVATTTATGCTNNMMDSVTVNINALPTAYTVFGSSTSYCVGGTGVVIYVSGTDLGVNYQLYRGGTPVGVAIAGTGTTAIDFGPQTVAGVYTVKATNAATGCTRMMTGSAGVTINPLPLVTSVTGGGNYCLGTAGVDVGLAGTVLGLHYQLFRDTAHVGAPINGTGAPISFGSFTTTGTYMVVATNNITGCSSNMTGSATVGINPLPVAYTVTGGGAYCAGGTGVGINLNGSVTGTDYRLELTGTPVGGVVPGTGLPIGFGTISAPGTYDVVATITATGCTSTMTGVATVVVNSLPSAFSVTGGGDFCPGGSGVTVGLYGSVNGIRYQLYRGTTTVGAPVWGNGLPVDFGLQTTSGVYTVVATDTATGCTKNMMGSATVGNYPLPVVYNVTGGGAYCSGGTGVNIGLSGSNSGITYHLISGGIEVGTAYGTGSIISFGNQTVAASYTVTASSSTTGCTNSMTGSASVSINPLVTPGVAIVTSSGTDTVCNSVATVFTATATNGGTAASFQWLVNSFAAGSSNTYTYIPVNGDVVRVLLTSNAACATPDTAGSSIIMVVLPQQLPSVTVAALPGNVVCRWSSVAYSATPAFGGNAPSYTWKKNGVIVGSNSAAFIDTPSNGEIITCILTSNYQCRTANSVLSNSITMQVDTPITPSVTVTASPSNYIVKDEQLTFTATVNNAVVDPAYQWYVNGHAVPGETHSTYTDNVFTDLQDISCKVTSGGGCGGTVGTSNTVKIHVSDVAVQLINAGTMDVQLMPNPNKGAFTLKGNLGTIADQEITVELTNMLGQVIYNGRILARNGAIDSRIQLADKPANGMYILSLRSGTENKVFHMVIEQ